MEAATEPMPVGPAVAPDRSNPTDAPWSALHRIAFRIGCAYLVVYALDMIASPGNDVLIGNSLGMRYYAGWQAIATWVGLHFFHLTARQVGSIDVGDGVARWIQNLCQLAIALLTALVWSVVDRQRPHYRGLYGWLRLLIRYVLAYTLFDYGFNKLLPLQMKPTEFSELVTPYGEFTRQSVLWRFMGASQLYTVFSGAVEVAGAALLLFRRTTTLGALLCVAALGNVFLLNVSYDVNVKLFSLNLLLMAAFLLVPDVKPLVDFLVFHRAAVPARNLEPVFHRRSLRIAATACWILVSGSMLYHYVPTSWRIYKQYYINPERPPLLGLYEVQSFSRNGQQLPPLTTDSTRWYKVTFDTHWDGRGPGYMDARMMDGTDGSWRVGRIRCEFDAAKSSVTLAHSDPSGRIAKDTLMYSRPDPDHVLMDGRLGVAWRGMPGNDTDSVSILLRRIDTSAPCSARSWACFPILWPTHWIRRPAR